MCTSQASTKHILLNHIYGAKNYNPLPVVIERGEGVWVYDIYGKRYLDCLSAYSAVNQGHCHPRIVEVARRQAGRLTLTSRAFLNTESGSFFEEVAKLCGKDKVLPMNTGAEAVETAIKTARKWGYQVKKVDTNKAEIIVFENNFHGRTVSIISFSTELQYRRGFGPFTPGFRIVRYGDIEAVRTVLNKNTVAVLMEPIQGEAGIIIPPRGFLKDLKKLCVDNHILLIADEIQTGLGRTGKMFCCDHEEVVPDVYVLGKALGGGYPVSAVVADEEVLGVFQPGDHGSTFGGNPFACAIAREAIRVTVEENLLVNAAQMGNYFMEELCKINSPYIKEVRGKGLLVGIELETEAGTARSFCEKLMSLGILCKETHESVIRFAPPLVIAKCEIDWALSQIRKVFL